MKINNVVVIGSGTMGSGIAAQLCNANIPVTLLDLKTEISQKAKERIEKSRPPLLIDKSKIDGIKVGNISDDFNIVSEADWIVEAVVERIDIKHDIYEKIFKQRKKDSIVSSNTSSIPISVLSEKMSEDDKKDLGNVSLLGRWSVVGEARGFCVAQADNCEDLQKWLMNWVIGKAGKKPKIQAMLTDMLASKESQAQIHSKFFLLKMFLF